MNNVFDINRFGKFVLYELKRAYSNSALSALICAGMPAIMFVFVQLFSLIFWGHMNMQTGQLYGFIAGAASLAAVVIAMPAKLFGQITDKRFGSDWLMIPASTLEKSLGVILVSAVIFPLVVCALFLGIDFTMSLIFGKYYGTSLLDGMGVISNMISESTKGGLDINLGGMSILSFSEDMLIFTLGALCFKTNKPAKTILTLILISSVFGLVVSACALWFGDGIKEFFNNFSDRDPEYIIKHGTFYFNLVMNLWYFIVFGGLGTAIYYRIKTIKH